MSDKLNPYPKYKDSGVPWLGQIPEHWDVRRNGRLFAQRNETGFGELPILEVSLRTGVRVRDMDNLKRKQVMSDAEKYKRAAKGDIAYNMMRMWQGALGTAPVDGLVSPAYVVARPFEETNPNYYSYLFRTEAYKAEVDGYSRGIVKDRNRLYWHDFKCMPSCFPPPEEQAAIVHFLDANAVLVRQFIRNRRRLIDALTEQKQAIINRAVTRGLNPNVRMKPSGVDWLGEVPEHWDVQRLKFLADIGTGGKDTVNRIQSGAYPFFVRSQNVERIDTYSFDGEAVLTAGDGAGVAKVFHYANGKFDFHQRVYKFSHFRRVQGKFFFHYFKTMLRFEAFRETAKSTVDSLRMPMLQSFPVTLPELGEQRQIVDWIEESTVEMDNAIRIAECEIVRMREFRSRLIEDVVSGKIDCQKIASEIEEFIDREVSLPIDEDDLEDDQVLDEELEHADD